MTRIWSFRHNGEPLCTQCYKIDGDDLLRYMPKAKGPEIFVDSPGLCIFDQGL